MGGGVGGLANVGIRLRSNSAGNHKVICPRCSAGRKPQNRKDPCLSVTIGADGGATWFCHNCNWETPRIDDNNADSVAFWGQKEGRKWEKKRPAPAAKANDLHFQDLKGGAYRCFEGRGIGRATVARGGIKLATKTIP